MFQSAPVHLWATMKKARAVSVPERPTGLLSLSKTPTPPENNGKSRPESRPESGSTTPRKNSSTEKPNGKLLNKGYLSKSQDNLSKDNLASQLRRKAVAASMGQKGPANNKENTVTFKTPSLPKTKVKSSDQIPSKERSHSVDSSGGQIKRAQSAQNITKPQLSTAKPGTNVKRASSTQNISKGGVRQVRISAPVNIMAYNAELLASFEKEKKALDGRISELIQVAENRKTEIEKYKFEVKNLKEKIPPQEVSDELEMLRSENRHLKKRLEELGVPVEPVTDTEKLSMLKKSSSAESDIKGATGGESVCGYKSRGGSSTDGMLDFKDLRSMDSELGLSVGDLSCITPEHPSSLSLENNWDKMSNKSSDAMSEVSVACLQDRILQMEETHYSTNEELQATMQELIDLQDAVNDLSNENERLADERQVLLESLCAQTEKLENCRMQIEHLKALLVSESEGGDRSENERQLVGLIKTAQEERDEFILKQIELSNTLYSYENENREMQDVITALKDKTQILEMKNESLTGDKRALETQLAELKESSATDHIELQRYKTLYENEKTKVTDLEQCRNATDKSDLEEILDNTRQEKEKLDCRLADIQEELALSQNTVARVKDQMSSMEEELKVSKNNAKKEISDLIYKMDQAGAEKSELQQQMETLREHIDQLQIDCDRYLEEKKTDNATISKLETELKDMNNKMDDLKASLNEAKSRFTEEKEEWTQFQADLQTAVVIANDMKCETQEHMERMVNENFSLKERNRSLQDKLNEMEDNLEKYKQKELQTTPVTATSPSIRARVLTPITPLDRELQNIRQSRKISDLGNQNLSVKNLIASIEHQVKTDRGTPPLSPSLVASQCSSRRGSTDSSISLASVKSESPTKTGPDRRSSMPADSQLKSALRKPAEPKEQRPPLAHRHTITNLIYDKAPPIAEDTKQSPPGLRPEPAVTTRSALKKPSPRWVVQFNPIIATQINTYNRHLITHS